MMVSFPQHDSTSGGLIAFPASRRVRETPEAKRAYADYEALGPERTLAHLYEWYQKTPESVPENGKKRFLPSMTSLKRWSRQHDWQKKLLEYEEAQLELRRKKRQDEIEKMDERHATFGRSSLFSVMQYMQDHFAQEATLPDAIRLMKVAYELERLARGAATSKVDADVKIQVLPKEYVNIAEDEIFSEP